MTAFRIFLIVMFVWMAGYTAIVIVNHGFGLFGVFFGDIAKMGWPGQFNVDFLSFLMLSALWLAWRNQFSPTGLILGIGGFFLGAPFLSGYLLYAISQANGDMKEVLLGKQRVAAQA